VEWETYHHTSLKDQTLIDASVVHTSEVRTVTITDTVDGGKLKKYKVQ